MVLPDHDFVMSLEYMDFADGVVDINVAETGLVHVRQVAVHVRQVAISDGWMDMDIQFRLDYCQRSC